MEPFELSEEVIQWLKKNKFSRFQNSLEKLGVYEMEDFQFLKEEDLKNSEIPVVQQRKLLKLIQNHLRWKDNSKKMFDVFISHRQKNGGELALNVKMLLQQKNKDFSVFLDVDDIQDLHNLANNVKNSKNLLLILTEGALERPFVQLEIRAAIECKRKITILWDKENCVFPEVTLLPDDIQRVLKNRAIPWSRERRFREACIEEIIQKIREGNKQFEEATIGIEDIEQKLQKIAEDLGDEVDFYNEDYIETDSVSPYHDGSESLQQEYESGNEEKENISKTTKKQTDIKEEHKASGGQWLSKLRRNKKKSNLSGVKLQEMIGRGHFGEVYRGLWKRTVVACKKSKSSSSVANEARILGQLNHPNIIRSFGTVVIQSQTYLVMEYAEKGDLLNFLIKEEKSIRFLLNIIVSLVEGMMYLAERCVIHRDLSCRNILLTKDDTPKICDFELARISNQVYLGKSDPIAFKWSAPEVWKKRKCSVYSDVWSFGIVMWEILSKGKLPYGKMNNTETMEQVLKGYRLPKPEGCPEELYAVILDCWREVPTERPDFETILEISKEALFKQESKDDATPYFIEPGNHFDIYVDQPCLQSYLQD